MSNSVLPAFGRRPVGKLVWLIGAFLLFAGNPPANAQQAFKTPEEAAEALASAARTGDRNAMLAVLGRAGADIVSSGDDAADAATRQKFLAAYDAKHQVTIEGDRKAVVIVGTDDFPFPIPLIRTRDMWQFDTVAGRQEILARRIGRNELSAIQTCLAYVDAQDEYAEKDRTGAGPGIYAQRIVSHANMKDGLYWPEAAGEEPSPLGEFFAKAAADLKRNSGLRIPYQGYYYKILTGQGPSAPGGVLNYVVGGKMIGGFALVAYPAIYRNSGVMTFLVSHEGVVYEKDLGPRTAQLAERMMSFNPDQTWSKVPTTPAK